VDRYSRGMTGKTPGNPGGGTFAFWRRVVLPSEFRRLAEKFRGAGEELWFCGGTVRDLFLGRRPGDLDLATTAEPESAAELLGREVLEGEQPGRPYGSLHGKLAGRPFELTSLRAEGRYVDGRRPFACRFLRDPKIDAHRRDFTCNALYLGPADGKLLDPLGGLRDLRARRLRVIGEGENRFREDPLRILRGLRLAASLDLVPDRATWTAIRACSGEVGRVPKERAFLELTALLTGRGRGRGLLLLEKAGILPHILPEAAALVGVPQPRNYHPEGDVFRHTCLVLAHLEEPPSGSLAWAALCHDFGKPETLDASGDRIRFHGHDRLSADMARACLLRFHAPADLREEVVELCAFHIGIASFESFRPSRREAFLRSPLFPSHLALHRADCLASHRKLDLHKIMLDAWKTLDPEPLPPLLTGKDLLALGYAQGPRIGEALARIADARAAGRIRDATEALRMARELLSGDS